MTHGWPALAARRDTPSIVPQLLREYGDATRRMVEYYLATDRPAPYLHDLLTDYPRRGGKMMRPSICIANARAFGARMEDGVKSAAAVEILHNALLIHDDIQDESEVRRGHPTLHALHSVALAINAGDAMLLLAMRPLLDNIPSLGSHVSMRILEETQAMARETAEGRIAVFIDPAQKIGAILEMRCESPPVVKSEHFDRRGPVSRSVYFPSNVTVIPAISTFAPTMMRIFI